MNEPDIPSHLPAYHIGNAKEIKPVENFSATTRGQSMLPLIKDGDKISYRPVNEGKVDIGQVVLAFDGKHFFSHRIIDRIGSKYVLKGDNNHYIDGLFEKKSLIGAAVSEKVNDDRFSVLFKEKEAFWAKITFTGNLFESSTFQKACFEHMPFHFESQVPSGTDLHIGIDRTSGITFSEGLLNHFEELYNARSVCIDFSLKEDDPHKDMTYTYCWNIEGQYQIPGLDQKDQCLMIIGMLSQCLTRRLRHDKSI